MQMGNPPPGIAPQFPPGAGLVAGHPGVKQFHWPATQSHSLPLGYGQRRLPAQVLLSAGVVAGQRAPLPAQRQTRALFRIWQVQRSPRYEQACA